MGGGMRGGRTIYRRSGGSSGDWGDRTVQTEISSHTKKPIKHITSKDVVDVLLPIIKEIGKTVFPQAAYIIELGYQLYTHWEVYKKVKKLLEEGKVEEAKKIIKKEAVKDAVKVSLSQVENPVVDSIVTQAVSILEEKDIVDNKVEKGVAEGAVKGTIKQPFDKINEKMGKKVADKVVK